jgi:hypothetical protein
MSNAYEILTEKQKHKDNIEIHLNEALWEVVDGNN